MLKYLRIAVTVLSLTVCVLLIALWVRSYRYREYFTGTVRQRAIPNTDGWRAAGETVFLVSANGVLQYVQASGALTDTQFEPWRYGNFANLAKEQAWKFKYGWPETIIHVPHWFPILIAIVLAELPWLPWRFSLRALLIATTLVAVGLGIIISTS